MTETNLSDFAQDHPFAKLLAGRQTEENTEVNPAEEQKPTTEQEQEKTAEQEAPVEVDFNELLKQKSGGKYSSLEDLEKQTPEPKKIEIPEFKDDIEKLMWAATQKNDYGKIREIINLNPESVNNISDLDAVRTKLKSEMPGLSDADLEDELYERYGLGYKPLTQDEKDVMSDDQIASHEKDMKRFARQLKNDAEIKRNALKSELESKKQSMLESYKDVLEAKEEKVESTEHKEKVAEEAPKLTKDQEAELQRNFEAEVSKQVKEVSTFKLIEKVPVSETEEIDVNIDYELSADEAKQLTDFIANYELTPSEEAKYVKRNGAEVDVDLKGLIQDKAKMLFSANFQKVLVKEAVTKAKEHVIKTDLKRVNLTPESITDRSENISDKSKAQADFMTQWANGIKVQGT